MSGAGEVISNVRELPVRKRVKRRGGGIEGRVAVLEERMETAEKTLASVKDDTATIRAAIATASGIAGFVKKHGPRAVAFGTGLAVYAGVIDGELGRIIGAFFTVG